MNIESCHVKAALGLCWLAIVPHHGLGAQYAMSVAYSNNAVVIAWPAEYIGSTDSPPWGCVDGSGR